MTSRQSCSDALVDKPIAQEIASCRYCCLTRAIPHKEIDEP